LFTLQNDELVCVQEQCCSYLSTKISVIVGFLLVLQKKNFRSSKDMSDS